MDNFIALLKTGTLIYTLGFFGGVLDMWLELGILTVTLYALGMFKKGNN